MSRQGLHHVVPGLAIAAALNLTAPGRGEAAWVVRANPAPGWSDAWSATWNRGASWWDDLWARVGRGPSRRSRPSTEARFSGVSRKEDQHDGDSPWLRVDDQAPGSQGGCAVNPNGICVAH
jgi:hypothetical protein